MSADISRRVTAGQNIDRLRSEGAFAALCGASPIPASSGRTTRHRLKRYIAREAYHALQADLADLTALHAPPRHAVSISCGAGFIGTHRRHARRP